MIARLRARETDRRKDWAEKASTGIARRFDVIRVEDLRITDMTRSAKGTRQSRAGRVQKVALNRAIWCGWVGRRTPAEEEGSRPAIRKLKLEHKHGGEKKTILVLAFVDRPLRA